MVVVEGKGVEVGLAQLVSLREKVRAILSSGVLTHVFGMVVGKEEHPWYHLGSWVGAGWGVLPDWESPGLGEVAYYCIVRERLRWVEKTLGGLYGSSGTNSFLSRSGRSTGDPRRLAVRWGRRS